MLNTSSTKKKTTKNLAHIITFEPNFRRFFFGSNVSILRPKINKTGEQKQEAAEKGTCSLSAN